MPVPRVERNQAIDWLRGAVMILMALDHSRMFVGTSVDLHTASPGLYFTRWVTHFCAPVFVLLAGTAAYLHGRRLGSTRALSRYLLTRGLWLAFLEVTVIRAAWMLLHRARDPRAAGDLGDRHLDGGPGRRWSGCRAPPSPRSPSRVIAGHNVLDSVHAAELGGWRWLWLLLHEEGGLEPFPGARWFVIYPLVPWLAVMAAGYVIGPWALLPRAERRQRFLRAGLVLIGGFVVLRATNSTAIRTPGLPTTAPCARCSHSSTARSIRPRCCSWR